MENIRCSGQALRGLALGLALCMALPAMAANNDGSVVGHTLPGAVVTIVSPDNGFTRTVTADDKGNYRFPFLPIGRYTLSTRKDGAALGAPLPVTVSLGNATTVNVGSKEATNLGTIEVKGDAAIITAVDVTSTETATNLSRQELARLPVEQNVASVALLAPGVNAGNAGFGGLSFGGSSVAENSFYINGLNVTDFYNRNGFSSAPFAFYQEFQVKTGGYSVEFGRSTGGVINAVARSGSNTFHYGAELTTAPTNWQSAGSNHYRDGQRYLAGSEDRDSLTKLNLYASGPIVKDKLFFFAMYEGRANPSRNTNDDGTVLTRDRANDGFWGATIDWHVTDKNLLSLMAFSDQNNQVGDVYSYDFARQAEIAKTNMIRSKTGGRNWALTDSWYLTDDLSMKLMVGRNQREDSVVGLSDLECNNVVADSSFPRAGLPGVPLGCTTNTSVIKREDTRKQARADFEWTLGSHLLRFGIDHEQNTSDYLSHYPGPEQTYYTVYGGLNPGATLPNGGILPAGYTSYVRARQNQLSGTFESVNSAYYLEDNWQATSNLLLNLGLRMDAFNNKAADGTSFIKIDHMLAPRLGFSWDLHGDGSAKLYGNLGRYYLPVANVINIKEAGALLDSRTYYAFNGWQVEDRNGNKFAMPALGPQLGPVDDSQGNGTVGDLRSKVDKNMDPVYQDEAILGFQQMLDKTWSWGVSATYRRLHNAIDDMEISATPQCGGAGYIGYVMGNPGKKATVWGDTNCDGKPDGWVTIDTAKQGWALYDSAGNYLGQRGWKEPKRSYTALEFQLDRAWDEKWSFNASYTLSWNRGNAEGPVDSDTGFADTGRTENFDDPFVNLSSGYLPNDHRHQLKLRGTYALSPHWQLSADATILSGGPITGYGVGNPYDATNYHSYYICVQDCADSTSANRVYELSSRGKYGRLPWTYLLNAGITYLTQVGEKGKLKIKLSIYNLLNQQRTVQVEQDRQIAISDATNPAFLEGLLFQPPRYAQLTATLDF